MASDQSSSAIEASLLAATGHHPPTVASAAALPTAHQSVASESVDFDLERPRILKRPRETTPTSPPSPLARDHSAPAGSPIKSARFGLSSRRSPAPLTAAAALEDQRRQREEQDRLHLSGSSENPNQRVLSVLAGDATSIMSRPTDAPLPAVAPPAPQAPTASMDTTPKPSQPVPNTNPPTINGSVMSDNHIGNTTDVSQTSPQSATSAVSINSALVTASPAPMDMDAHMSDIPPPTAHTQIEDKLGPGSMSYPGSLQASGVSLAPQPQRNISYPAPSAMHDSPGQPSGKKHKCPYCETEFTRHHNLKSHLLTHSQEKPFICQQCDSRFRRLHDLKRHSKLHTGEKPHICPKCNRKFARGDALARHSKGAGGCAGRRSSMGSFVDGDGMDGSGMHDGDDSMTGIAYPHDEGMTDDERRHLSLPSIKASHITGSIDRPPGGLYPPPVSQERGVSGGSATVASLPAPSGAGHVPAAGGASVQGNAALYAPGGGMTESPKPLSPATTHENAALNRQRSLSLTQQLQQQHLNRRPSERHTSPTFTTSTAPSGGGAAVSQGRTLSSSHTGDNSGNMFASDPGIWDYIQTLEDRFKQLSDDLTAMQKADSAKQAQIGLLTTEMTLLKKQLQTQEAESSKRQAQVGLLTTEITDLKRQLQVSGTDAATAAPKV